MVEFDQFLEKVGEFGKYQRIMYVLVCFVGIIAAFNNMNSVFTAATPPHWCSVPELSQFGLSEEEIKNLTIPLEEEDGERVYSQCKMYNRNYSGLTDLSSIGGDDPGVVACRNGWTYDTSLYQSTIVMDVSIRFKSNLL